MADLFAEQADAYRKARPTYPDTLFRQLAERSPRRDLALDCGAGSGQATMGLSSYFATVIASDRSLPQLRRLPGRAGVAPVLAEADRAPLRQGGVDLVIVAQALHWFPLEAFYREVARVLRPDGLLAVWSYGRIRVSPAVDRLVAELHDRHLAPWWDPARAHVENGYRDLPFPYPRLPMAGAPERLQAEWSLPRMLAYLESWSALQTCRRQTGNDPLAELVEPLQEAWGAGPRTVWWPLTLRVGHAG